MRKRYLLVAVAGFAITALIVVNWGEIIKAIQLIKTSTWQILLVIPVIRSTSMLAVARFYQSFLAAFKYRVSMRKLFPLTLAVNFVNQISPSAGVTGATFLSYNLRDEVPAGKTTLVEYGRYFLTYTSYAIFLAVALGLVYFGGGIDRIIVRIVLLLVGGGLLLSIVFMVALSSKGRFDQIVFLVQRFIDRISHWFRRDNQPLVGKDRIRRLLSEFHHGYDLVLRERRRLRDPLIYAMLSNLLEVTSLYIIFLSLGQTLNPGVVIISYAVANAVGTISLVPGDFGIYEVALVTALSAIGVPLALALSATILYRLLNKAILLPAGFIFYTRLISRTPKARITQGDGTASP